MPATIATVEDLNRLKEELLTEMRSLLQLNTTPTKEKKWLKTAKARELLSCSVGTLRNYRIHDVLHPKILEGTYYYSVDEINKILKSN